MYSGHSNPKYRGTLSVTLDLAYNLRTFKSRETPLTSLKLHIIFMVHLFHLEKMLCQWASTQYLGGKMIGGANTDRMAEDHGEGEGAGGGCAPSCTEREAETTSTSQSEWEAKKEVH